ncbi:hypothetical protein GCM10027280_43350 [Micromonospora polyrhachis]
MQGTDQLTLPVVAEHVDVHGAQSQCPQPQGHVVTGLPGAHLDRRDVVTVLERQRQVGHVDNGVDAGTTEHQHVGLVRQLISLVPAEGIADDPGRRIAGFLSPLCEAV